MKLHHCPDPLPHKQEFPILPSHARCSIYTCITSNSATLKIVCFLDIDSVRVFSCQFRSTAAHRYTVCCSLVYCLLLIGHICLSFSLVRIGGSHWSARWILIGWLYRLRTSCAVIGVLKWLSLVMVERDLICWLRLILMKCPYWLRLCVIFKSKGYGIPASRLADWLSDRVSYDGTHTLYASPPRHSRKLGQSVLTGRD